MKGVIGTSSHRLIGLCLLSGMCAGIIHGQTERVGLSLRGQLTATNGPVVAVAVMDGYAYCATVHGGIVIADVRDPSTPQKVGEFDTAGPTSALTVSGDYAYVGEDNALEIVNISDPIEPKLEGSCVFWNGAPSAVALQGNYAFVAMGTFGMQVIDITEPTTPEWVASCNTDGSATDVTISGNTAYLADGGGGLQIIDISSPAEPLHLGGSWRLGGFRK